MGPRLCRRGDLHDAFRALLAAFLLQWDRAFAGAEIGAADIHDRALSMLQWDRAFAGAEM